MLGLSSKLTSLQTILKKLFLKKFKFTLGSELVTNGTFDNVELVTNGTFDNDISNWTVSPNSGGVTASHTNGTLRVQKPIGPSSIHGFQQSFTTTPSASYKVTVDVVATTASKGRVQIGHDTDRDAYYNTNNLEVGSHTFDVTTGNFTNLQIRLGGSAGTDNPSDIQFDNVSCKEVLTTVSNWSQISGATISNSNGTINIQTTNYNGAQQVVTVSQNTAYRISLDVVSTTTSTGRIYIGTTADKDAYGNHSGLAVGTHTFDVTTGNNTTLQLRLATADQSGNVNFDNVSCKEITKRAPLAAFSLRKLGNVSPYACRIRRSSDNTEAQVEFSGSAVSESSIVRNTSANLLSFSEQLNNTSHWTSNGGGTATLSTITDPFGGTNSYEVSGGSETYGGIYETVSAHSPSIAKLLTTGKNYVYSIYLKKLSLIHI